MTVFPQIKNVSLIQALGEKDATFKRTPDHVDNGLFQLKGHQSGFVLYIPDLYSPVS
jgi:hypothetical protein